MDLDLLSRVTGQPVEPGMTETVLLAGYRRTGLIGRNYPILVRDPPGRVSGLLVRGLMRRASRRLDTYEGINYILERVTVANSASRPAQAVMFEFVGALRSNRRHWRLDRWQRRWKRRTMRRAGRLKDIPKHA